MIKITDTHYEFSIDSDVLAHNLLQPYVSELTFGLTCDQATQFAEWSKHHAPSFDALGTQYKFSFTPTGLGTVAEVTNLLTNETLNLTDYNSW